MTHLLLALLLFISACSSTQTERIDAEIDIDNNPDKILIVYLSRTSNTRTVAEMIQRNVGGKLVALELEKPYPANYPPPGAQVAS